jgi:hypothetical protein
MPILLRLDSALSIHRSPSVKAGPPCGAIALALC